MIAANIQEQLLQDALRQASLSVATSRQRMLGGLGISVKGRLFALILQQGTALKLSEPDQENLLRMPGASRYEVPGDPARSRVWVVVPEPLMDQTNHYAGWVRKAFELSDKAARAATRAASRAGRNGR